MERKLHPLGNVIKNALYSKRTRAASSLFLCDIKRAKEDTIKQDCADAVLFWLLLELEQLFMSFMQTHLFEINATYALEGRNRKTDTDGR